MAARFGRACLDGGQNKATAYSVFGELSISDLSWFRTNG
jgi:hypothetical protein